MIEYYKNKYYSFIIANVWKVFENCLRTREIDIAEAIPYIAFLCGIALTRACTQSNLFFEVQMTDFEDALALKMTVGKEPWEPNPNLDK